MIDASNEILCDSARPIAMPPSRPVNRREATVTTLRYAICGALATAFFCAPDRAAAGLLDGITGTWTGRGKVTFQGGNSEDLSCRAYYATRGSILSLAIRCASTSYKTEIRSKLQISKGSLTGEWEERNFNAVGSASGTLSGNTIVLRISGAIEGRLIIDQSGSHQAVAISTKGGSLSSVKIGLSKS